MQRDLIYSTRVGGSVREIERSLPDGSILSAYTAFNYLFNEVPADYSEVWTYVPEDIRNCLNSASAEGAQLTGKDVRE